MLSRFLGKFYVIHWTGYSYEKSPSLSFNVWTKNTPSLMLEFHSLHDRKCAKFWPKIREIFSLAATRALSDLI